jgi:DNA invertase Pin-like site-specific DNA recombinase
MTVVAYIFLDRDRSELIPLVKQQEELENYVHGLDMHCREFLIEENCSCTIPFSDRKEAKHLLENVQAGDVIFTLRAKWVMGSPQEALQLLALLKEKQVSLYCVDLKGDIVKKTERKLQVNEGIAPLVLDLCKALSITVNRKSHAEAIRAGKARKKKDGKYLGGPVPFGFFLGENDCLQKDEKQQKIIKEMQNLKDDRWSYRNIAKKLEEEYGLKFSHEGVRRILMKQSLY